MADPNKIISREQFDEEWDNFLFGTDANVVVCRATAPGGVRFQASEPIGYENLVRLLGSPTVARLPLREAYGKALHVYVPACYESDPSHAKEAQSKLPLNRDVSALLRHNGLHQDVFGDAVFVMKDAIHDRDMQSELIAVNAQTIPEIERDHDLWKGPEARRQWEVIQDLCNDRQIPGMLSAVPDANRVAWLLRAMFVGLELDIETYAAVQEACSKNPLLAQVMLALENIQSYYFAGRYDELVEADDQGPQRPVTAPLPAGFSKIYGRVVH